jgi:hypothetical protein
MSNPLCIALSKEGIMRSRMIIDANRQALD